MRYAYKTSVPKERSKAEIEKILNRYGATHFGYLTAPEGTMISFVKDHWKIRFVLPLPQTPSQDATQTSIATYEQIVRQAWRALVLIIKAKLEAVESGICTFQEEFMAHIVLPNGRTAGEHMLPRIAEAYESGKIPALGWEGK